MRGTLEFLAGIDEVRGIIPALAGNTSSTAGCSAAERDHPRACGEHATNWCAATFVMGSSPRLRGTPRSVRGCAGRRGIIPALAGNTSSNRWTCRRAGDHPRACGEHTPVLSTPAHCPGSSPRLRGTRERHRILFCAVGIIPALAGNTRCRRPSAHCRWDHPRACGEHSCRQGGAVYDPGSSPRLRGTRGAPHRHAVG